MKAANKDSIPQSAILSEQETDILLSYWQSKANEAYEKGQTGPVKTFSMISLMLGTGMRINEIAELKCEDCKVKTSPFYVYVVGKGDRFREIAISKKLATNLKLYLEWHELRYQECEYVFPNKSGKRISKQSVGQTWRKALKKAGLKPKRPHAARHTYATRFLDKHKNLRALQHQLGHANIVTTSRYLHISMQQISNLVLDD